MAALIDCVDAAHLCSAVQRWKREIRVASGLGQDLHFVVDAAVPPPCGIRQRPVPVYKRVHRLVIAGSPRQAPMLFGQNITKCFKRVPESRRTIGFINSVMKMHLYFAESFGLHLREHLEQPWMVLFSRIKICVPERCAIAVAKHRCGNASLAIPLLYSGCLTGKVEAFASAVPCR